MPRLRQWLYPCYRQPMALHVWPHLFLRHIVDIPCLSGTSHSHEGSYTQARPHSYLLAHSRMLFTRYTHCLVGGWRYRVGMDNLCICMAVRLCWYRAQLQKDERTQLLRNSLLCPHGTHHPCGVQALLRLRRVACCRLGNCRGYMLHNRSGTLQHTQSALHAHRISHIHYARRYFPHGGSMEDIRAISINAQHLQHLQLKKSKTKPIFRTLQYFLLIILVFSKNINTFAKNLLQ